MKKFAKLYADRFSNISTDFDNQLALVQHLTDTYNTGLDTLEAKGLKRKQGLLSSSPKS